MVSFSLVFDAHQASAIRVAPFLNRMPDATTTGIKESAGLWPAVFHTRLQIPAGQRVRHCAQ